MGLFRNMRKHEPITFEEDSLDAQFDKIMAWAKDLSRKDFNKLKKAMDKDYDAYQVLHGIEPTEDTVDEMFELSDKEGA